MLSTSVTVDAGESTTGARVLRIGRGCGDRRLRGIVHGDDIERRRRGRDGRATRYAPRQGPRRARVEIRRVVAR